MLTAFGHAGCANMYLFSIKEQSSRIIRTSFFLKTGNLCARFADIKTVTSKLTAPTVKLDNGPPSLWAEGVATQM